WSSEEFPISDELMVIDPTGKYIWAKLDSVQGNRMPQLKIGSQVQEVGAEAADNRRPEIRSEILHLVTGISHFHAKREQLVQSILTGSIDVISGLYVIGRIVYRNSGTWVNAHRPRCAHGMQRRPC